MRTTLRLLGGSVMALLLASCSPSGNQPKLTITSMVTVASAPAASDNPPTSSSAAAPEPPSPGAAFDQVAAWVESAPEAAASNYRTGTDYEGKKHSLDHGELAFTSPSQKITCYGSGGLYCSVDFQNPLPKPPTAYGNWLPGIVIFSDDGLHIGQGRGDPPTFYFTGNGPELPYGQKISFGEDGNRYTCRMEQSGLTCVNKAQGSGALLSDQGVVPYGCLRESAEVGNSAKAYKC
ncbi:hypothetical protein [Segniliparus rugosus]|uniref:hypothetical protein n=1 Tax=Segniliparus rugosus TaxID=286804 RepID=UPI0002DCA2E0|nr:hypothetical protein [Segniliparus rugosus]